MIVVSQFSWLLSVFHYREGDRSVWTRATKLTVSISHSSTAFSLPFISLSRSESTFSAFFSCLDSSSASVWTSSWCRGWAGSRRGARYLAEQRSVGASPSESQHLGRPLRPRWRSSGWSGRYQRTQRAFPESSAFSCHRMSVTWAICMALSSNGIWTFLV